MAAKKRSKLELKKMGRRNRNKGKTYERDVANALKEVYPKAARLYGQSRKGSDAPDIGGTPFWIEAGNGAHISIINKMNQAVRDSAESEDTRYKDRMPAVFTKTRRNQNLVTLRREDFIQLMKELEGYKDLCGKPGNYA